MIFVTAIDSLQSNYGTNAGKVTKLVFECDNEEIKDRVFNLLSSNKFLTDVTVLNKLPRNTKKIMVRVCTEETHPYVYQIK